jgi:hypothetical protein
MYFLSMLVNELLLQCITLVFHDFARTPADVCPAVASGKNCAADVLRDIVVLARELVWG